MIRLFRLVLLCFVVLAAGCQSTPEGTKSMLVGAEQPERYLPLLQGKRVGLVVNQTSRVNSQHLVDFLLDKNIDVRLIFAPEHGFRGDHDAGEKVDSNIDPTTGIPILSIYGKHKKPAPDKLTDVDVILFDIQDVGTRFYTYISSMHYMMEAAADAKKQFVVLDRPNPNGRYVDGPLLQDDFRSFVGMHDIPLLHGMTVAELAQMIVGEGWLKTEESLALNVIPVAGYQRDMHYSLPIKPSPNLPNDDAIRLYPSLCLFEATVVSVGRGTDLPFQVLGYVQAHVGQFEFTPESRPGAKKPKLMGKALKGQDLRSSSIQGFDLSLLIAWRDAFADQGLTLIDRPSAFDRLAGTDSLRKALLAGQSEQQIRQTWQASLAQFKQQRRPYLLYPE